MAIADDPLKTQLIILAEKLKPINIPLIIGGGYGLLLRTESIRRSGIRTRFPDFPPARSTEDLDIFFHTEIITDAKRFEIVRDVLAEVGYRCVEEAKYYQFVREIQYLGQTRTIKVDLLAGPVPPEFTEKVRIRNRRIKPRDTENLHAHFTPEALTVCEFLAPVTLDDVLDITVNIPHPFSYLLLKLFALDDRKEDPDKQFGRHHAYDIYRTIGMMTQPEWEQALMLREKYKDSVQFAEASAKVKELFSSINGIGVLRVREHALESDEIIDEQRLNDLLDDLWELFLQDLI